MYAHAYISFFFHVVNLSVQRNFKLVYILYAIGKRTHYPLVLWSEMREKYSYDVNKYIFTIFSERKLFKTTKIIIKLRSFLETYIFLYCVFFIYSIIFEAFNYSD